MAITIAELQAHISINGIDSADRQMQGFNRTFQSVGQNLTKFGAALSLGITAPLVLMGREVLQAGSSFESAFAGVRKTVDATESELAQMREGFRKLALEIPVSANEMAKIGEAAGALGVANADILGFTRVMADLGVATNLSSDQAATGLARLANIMKSEAGPQYDRMAAALVALGNAGASTESEILDMSLRIALAGKQAGLSKADVLSLSNALSSIGIEAEMGGSAISKAFNLMGDATKTGGKELQIFAKTAEMSVAGFKKAFADDAATAMISFVEGLQKMVDKGKSVTPVLEELHLADLRVRASLVGAASAGDLFRNSLELGSKAFAENTAHTKEAAERYKTFDSQLQLVKNQLTDIGITIFDKLRPALIGMLDSVKGVIQGFANLDENTIKMGATFLVVAGSAGPIALLIGKLLTLGPQGAVVVGVVAGSAAIAAAYAADFATVNRTITAHVALFTRETGSMGVGWSSLTDKIEIGTLHVVSGFERIVVAMERLSVNAVTAGKIMIASLSGNWTGIIQAWDEGRSKLEAIDKAWEGNLQARTARIHEIQGAAAWRDLWARTAAVNREGALASVKAWDDIFNKQNPAMSLLDALKKHKGPTIEAARAMGFEVGSKALGAWREGIEQKSPSGFEKDLARIEAAFAAFPNKIQKHIAGLSAAGKLLLKEFRDAAKGIVDDLNKHIRDNEIDKLIKERVAPAVKILTDAFKESRKVIEPVSHLLGKLSAVSPEVWSNQWVQSLGKIKIALPSLTPALDALREAVRNLKEDIASSPFFEELKMRDEASRAFEGVIQILEREGERLGETQDQINRRVLAGLDKFGAEMKAKYGLSADEAVAAYQRGMNRLPGALDEVFNKLALGAKRQVSGIFQVIDSIPGKFGDALRKSTNEITKWIDQIDGLLKGLHKIFAAVPDGLAGVFEKIVGVFKSTASTVSAQMADIADVMKFSSPQSQAVFNEAGSSGDTAGKSFAAGFLGKMALITAGVATFFSTRSTTGVATPASIAGAALAGAQIGAAFGGPFGAAVGAAIGLAVGGWKSSSTTTRFFTGGIFSAIFGGPSDADKAKIKQATEEQKINFQNSAQAVISSAIEGFDKALAFFNNLDEFTQVRKAKFRAFFANFTRLMDYFLELANKWSQDSLAKAKVAAEAIGPIAEAISALPAAFDAINGHFGIAESSIDRFFASFDQVMTAFFQRADVWIDGQSKRAKKVAERLNPVVTLISGFAGSLTAISGVSEPTDAMFEMFDRVLEKIVTHVEALSGKFDKSVLKVMANFAEKAGAALSLWTTAIEAIKATVDIKPVTDADATNITAGIELFIGKLAASLERMATTDLTRIVAFAATIIPIAAAIKAWADTSAAIRGYTVIAAESWDAIVADFNRAIMLMGILIGQGQQFEALAITLEGILKSGAQHLNDGISAMTAGVVGAAGALQDAFGHIQGGTVGATSAGAPMGAQSFKASSSQPITVNIGDVYLDGRRAPEQKQSLAAMVAGLIGSQAGQAQANRNNQPGMLEIVNFAKRTKFAY